MRIPLPAAMAAVVAVLMSTSATAEAVVPATGGVTPEVAVSVAAAPAARAARAALSPDRRTAAVPIGVPAPVARAIAAANRITRKPYRWGGGHGRWDDAGYDCSGAVSYVLHAAGLLDVAQASSGLMGFGRRGTGRWISVYAHGGHAYVVIAGLRFDTAGRGEEGPRWRPERRSPAGFAVRHPAGL